jgi:hypothetical protein
MTTEEERVQKLVREMYESVEREHWDLSPEDIRAQHRRQLVLFLDPKALVLVAAAAILIVAGFFLFSGRESHKPAVVAVSTTTTTTSTINPNTLRATLACLQEFAPGTSQSDDELIGRSLSDAKNLTAASGQTWRIVAQDGTCRAVTSDLQSGRVDLWVIGGRVVKAVVEGPSLTTTSNPTKQRAQLVVVPNVIALSQVQAEAALLDADLRVGNVSTVPSAFFGAGKVASEAPVAGSSVARGSLVELAVSVGH